MEKRTTMSTNRKHRATIAQETLNVLEHGRYTNSQGESVSITTSLALAKEHTIHYTPDDFDEVFSIRDKHVQKRSQHTAIEVTNWKMRPLHMCLSEWSLLYLTTRKNCI